jgi:V/A-type H+-transporting ATPase subunit E
MDDKIKEITEKLYREGVAKGEDRAREIISAAEEQAAAIIAGARQDADTVIAQARKQAVELQRTIEADIRLAAGQAMSALQQQIVDAVLFTVVDRPVAATLADPAALREFLKIVLQNWQAQSGEHPALELLLPESTREELTRSLRQGLQESLAGGIALRFSKEIKAGFQIRPQGSSFKISLTEADFQEFFKAYLRPKTRAFLFGQ